MTDLERLLELEDKLCVTVLTDEEGKEYEQLKFQFTKMSEKAEKYDAESNLRCPICHFEYYMETEQQIKQLKLQLEQSEQLRKELRIIVESQDKILKAKFDGYITDRQNKELEEVKFKLEQSKKVIDEIRKLYLEIQKDEYGVYPCQQCGLDKEITELFNRIDQK